MKKRNVLITGAGAPGIWGTIYSLKNNPDKQTFHIVVSDIQADPVGKYLADAFYQVPSPHQQTYIPEVLEIIKKEKIELLIPQTTREIEVLSEHLSQMEEIGCKVLVSPYTSILKANDKYLILEECKRLDIPYPSFFLVNHIDALKDAVYKLGYPQKKIIVKPRLSNGMRGVRVLTEEVLSEETFFNEKPSGLEMNLDTLLKIFKKESFPELLVTEYLPGKEYSVDVLRSKEEIRVVPRIRTVIRSGISFETCVDLSRKDIIAYSEKLAESLNLNDCFGFQFKEDEQGIPKILECNPRVQGTMVASAFAGFNMIYFAVMENLNGQYATKKITVRNNSVFKRYWGGLATS